MAEQGASAWLDLVLSRAAELRAAGILSIGYQGMSATFAPAEPVLPDGKIDAPDATVGDGTVPPLYDPASYIHGIVPGFSIEKFDVED